MGMDGASGYILTGIKVADKQVQQQPQQQHNKKIKTDSTHETSEKLFVL
jgi:hypothetical protein